ncbi:ABC transporter ATP-binding protein, partial [Rhizobiaceae sp. 2RAB30]
MKELRKVFGAEIVVKDVDIEVEDGEFIVLVGPSGCGKSTTLRMIAGLEGIDGGTIGIGERVVNGLHPADRDVAMVFQSYALYPHMSVRENISYGLRRRGLPRAEIDSRVQVAAAMLQLEALLHRRPAQLSGGQRQRVALGRAIVRQPAVFLMDEPLSNLDAKLRVEMRGELSRLHNKLGVTTVYVTHDQVEAMTMGDRIVVMNGGRIEQIGKPLDVYHRPASLFVARFLGLPEINVVQGWLGSDPSGMRFEASDFQLTLPELRGEQGEVVLGLRPQMLSGSLERQMDGAVIGEAPVVAVEHHGPESYAACVLGSTPLTVKITPGAPVRVGSRLSIVADLGNPHFFDVKSGRRIDALDDERPTAGER